MTNIIKVSEIGLLIAIATLAITAAHTGAAEPRVELMPVGGGRVTVSGRAEETVVMWMKGAVPEVGADGAGAAAAVFVEDLRISAPEKLELFSKGTFPEELAPEAMRFLAQQLKRPEHAPLKEKLARRRLEMLLQRETPEGRVVVEKDAASLAQKIKDSFPYAHKRLLDGRIDGEELAGLLARVRQTPKTAHGILSAKPREQSVSEILSEFSRRNQQGSALARLQSYSAEATLAHPDGSKQQIRIFRLRPNLFRLHVLAENRTVQVLASDGRRVWQEDKDGRVQLVSREAMGARKHLDEFFNPLLADEGYEFTRLDDGQVDGKKVFRLKITRADGSHYVARIDAGTYLEISREYDNGTQTRQGDFREVADIKIAHREETTDRNGRTTVFVLDKFIPNPGLLTEFFSPPARPSSSHLLIERLAAAPAGSSKLTP